MMKSLRKILYLALYKFDVLLKKPIPLIVVLCYHNLGNDRWRFSIKKSEFKKQIEAILKVRHPITLGDLNLYLTGKKDIKKPSFVLTFDDGCNGIMDSVDWINKVAIKPTLFLLTNPSKANHQELGMELPFLQDRDIKILLKNGWELGSHSATHSDFYKIGGSEKEEICSSKTDLERIHKVKINYFSYPRGRYNKIILDTVKTAGYKLAVTMDDGFINKKTHPYFIPRIGVDKTHSFEEFIATTSPSVIRMRAMIKSTFLAKYL